MPKKAAQQELGIKGYEEQLGKIVDEIRKMSGSRFIDSDDGWRQMEPGYSLRIPHPLALATVKRKLAPDETDKYLLVNELALDMRRVFSNFIRFNYHVSGASHSLQ
jgi:hypothetical protein